MLRVYWLPLIATIVVPAGSAVEVTVRPTAVPGATADVLTATALPLVKLRLKLAVSIARTVPVKVSGADPDESIVPPVESTWTGRFVACGVAPV